jgi:tetratricopeptide (TPR) repeat protein
MYAHGVQENMINRGAVRSAKGDAEGALRDYKAAIWYNASIHARDYAEDCNNRGVVRLTKRDMEGALEDFDVEEALRDFSEAIQHKPGYARAYVDRGLARPKATRRARLRTSAKPSVSSQTRFATGRFRAKHSEP